MKAALIFVTLFAAVSAIDQPVGFLRGQPDSRDLQLNINCNTLLQACNTATANAGAIIGGITTSFNASPATAQLAADVLGLVKLGLNINLLPLAQAIRGLGLLKRVRLVAGLARSLTSLVSISTTGNSVSVSASLSNIINTLRSVLQNAVGGAADAISALLGAVVTVLNDVVNVSVQVDLSTIVGIIGAVLNLVISLVQSLQSLAVSINLSTQCVADLLECNVVQFLLNILPSLQVIINASA
jgi:hypothetical protein